MFAWEIEKERAGFRARTRKSNFLIWLVVAVNFSDKQWIHTTVHTAQLFADIILTFLINNSIAHVTGAWSYEHVLIRSQTSFAVLKIFHYRGKCIAAAEVSSWHETKCKALKMFKSPMPIPRRPRSNLLELSEVNVFFYTRGLWGPTEHILMRAGVQGKVAWAQPGSAVFSARGTWALMKFSEL